jgi:hypothetical protein
MSIWDVLLKMWSILSLFKALANFNLLEFDKLIALMAPKP